ncbi:pilus assembly protein CpaE [Alkalibacillus filiformis]|uniref:Pilus assembly protein CpaE n=1 Tax=Alkalibacillus filiformis TaxID=200990 RepID=A0ABU0DT03_9BACI|nr:AAA family ATPase [Alkalibacillus filiformis]MDQ0351310.1 pilus assembly protein CpaE [Alkalibacillus filiformis]
MPHETERIHKQGEVISICSAKGGIGKTFMAVNLAVALNKKNVDVCVLDGDFQFGDIGLAFDVKPPLTIKDLAEEINQLDSYNLGNYIAKHQSGVDLLLAPEQPQYAELVTTEVIEKLMPLLKEQYDYIIVDAGQGLTGQMVDLIENADRILTVSTLEVASLRHTKKLLETIEQLGLGERTELVINRHNMESLIKADEVPEMLKVESAYYIPNNFKIAAQSLNLGVPVAVSHSKSDVSKSIFKLAQSLTVTDRTKSEKKKSSLLSKVFSKS